MMHDILDYLDVVVPAAFCCDEFEVSALAVLECQDFVGCGCAPYEEDAALYFASLMDHRLLLAVRSAWARANEEAPTRGQHVTLQEFLQGTVAHSARLAMAPNPPG